MSVIVGRARPGSRYRDELEGLAERYGVLDYVTFTHDRLDIRDWMAASEIVFSLCSDPPEAFGRTVPEALHLGVPVIGWDHGGVQETLAGMFPKGAVTPDDLARNQADWIDPVGLDLFLAQAPRIPGADERLARLLDEGQYELLTEIHHQHRLVVDQDEGLPPCALDGCHLSQTKQSPAFGPHCMSLSTPTSTL